MEKVEWRIFLDTSVFFAAVYPETGAARVILKLGEAETISLWIGPSVLKEMEAVLARKSPKSKGLFALLLHRARVQIGPEPDADSLRLSSLLIDYAPDARVLAEAIAIQSDYLVSFDRKHLVGNEKLDAVPVAVGTPGDFLAWYRTQLAGRA